ncbi:selenoprotein S B-like [Hydractinia symbiolongicarpus]|uniref:selenoprotein S B-like n=1 Tax=Hydractinia symbiolongicarpus TaxID=13093 RepID=UPI00254AC036|nr:selenoprotein S B-like [Hydractinia symbiolongicarpus]
MTDTTLENTTPDAIVASLTTAVLTIETYGWFILIGGFIVFFLYQKYNPSYKQWRKMKEEFSAQQEAKKHPDKTYQIQVAVEKSRQKLQQQVGIDSHKKKLKQEQLEEEKRRQKIEEWEKHKQGKGYHLKRKTQEVKSETANENLKPKKKHQLRPADYNPLMVGDGGSCTYRPGRRNVSGGG